MRLLLEAGADQDAKDNVRDIEIVILEFLCCLSVFKRV
jgi:hypothetical protein